ncbi:Kunitz-type serine protease inhibitor conotoxin Cal9.1a [Schistosoma japonicum]|nr:Kunitz-type serine protease inhibitor conotoxin Cal9.1a [Schistosoma japonicum]
MSKENIKSFFVSYEFWIFILPIVLIVLLVVILSICFTTVYDTSNSSDNNNNNDHKVPGGSQVISTKTNETINKICLEPIESGSCRASIQMYAFNVDQWRCISFIYGGCDGNSNRFASVEECEATCY